MNRYDVTNIRYTELVHLADELRACGALAEADHLDFVGPSPEFASVDNKSTDPDWNRPRNKVGDCTQQIAVQRALGMEQRFIDASEHLLQLFRGLQAMQQPQAAS